MSDVYRLELNNDFKVEWSRETCFIVASPDSKEILQVSAKPDWQNIEGVEIVIKQRDKVAIRYEDVS